MKTFLPLPKAALPSLLFFFLFHENIVAQDSALSDNFKKGVIASSISAQTGYQSAILNWSGASFPSTGTMNAGYLVFYSTSTPSMLNSPNGQKPENAVLNGTVVSASETILPNQPLTSINASGLTDGTTYIFMIVAYVWDGVNDSTYSYSSGSTICLTIPPDAPASINFPAIDSSSSAISGTITQPLFQPDGYVVTYSANANAPALANGINYTSGQAFAGDTVVQVGNSVSFNTNNSGYRLSQSSTYYIHVFSYVLSGCTNQPVYSTGYLSDSISTSAIKNVDTAAAETLIETIDVEPNPVQTNGWLRITTLKADNNVSVTIFTIDGKLIVQKAIQVQVGVNRTNLYTENLSRGVYVLRAIFSNGRVKSIPFVKR